MIKGCRFVIMKRMLLILFLLLLLPSSSLAETRILAGEEVRGSDFSSMASLVEKQQPYAYRGHFCGGTVVAPRWVLTAAHCAGGWKDTDVIVGRRDLSQPGGERLAVVAGIIHPGYGSKGGNPIHDLALLRLSGTAPRENMDLRRQKVRPGENLFVAGWGETEYGSYPAQLRSVRVRSFSDRVCQNRYPSGRSFFCAGRKGGKFDSCYGDSGGPIVSRWKGEERLTGVVSFGEGCGHPRWPGAYARISSSISWIERVLRSNPSEANSAPGRDAFTSRPVSDLGPLADFRILENENDFELRAFTKKAWPAKTISVSVSDGGEVCSEAFCNLPSWPMKRYDKYSLPLWRIKLSTSLPCPGIKVSVSLSNGDEFIYHASPC